MLHNYILYQGEPSYAGIFPLHVRMTLILTDFREEADLHSKILNTRSALGPIFFIFTYLGWGPPLRNPGSTTGHKEVPDLFVLSCPKSTPRD